jgi:hypothetical protein
VVVSGESRSIRVFTGPPRGKAIGHTDVARAIGRARDSVIPAKDKIFVSRIVERPATFAMRELKQGTAVRTVEGFYREYRCLGLLQRYRQDRAYRLALGPRGRIR